MKKKTPALTNELRIIGGTYRSRKLSFPSEEGLRPTGNRIRETLFNWLAPEITGAHCLDLFAGSGALGMEALSRGAADCLFIDRSQRVCESIRKNLDQLDPKLRTDHKAEVMCADSINGLTNIRPTAGEALFDIVFVDPPFALNIASQVCNQLEVSGLLSSPCLVYLETSSSVPAAALPTNWQVSKERTSGHVCYQLLRRQA